MSVGLRDVLELPEARQAELNDQAEQFRQSFSEGMEGLNRHFQLMAGQANPADYKPLEAQKMKLYEAFQKTSAMIDPLDPSKGEQSIERVMGALKAVEGKASEAATGVTAGRDKWSKREDDFDDVLVRVGELEDAGNPKAATLRKLAETIRGKANARSYDQSVTAFDQLRPKFDQIYTQHQQVTTSTGPIAAGGAARGDSKSAPQGAATPTAVNGSTGFITGSVGKGGKNSAADVKAVQESLIQRGGAKLTADGKFGPKTLKAIEEFQKKLGQFKPDGVIQPGRGTARALSGAAPIPPTPPEPKPIAPPVLGKATLDKGALVWHSTRGILNTNIEELKKGVRAHYGMEHRDLLTAIDQSMVKLGKVVDKLDTRLADTLDSACKAPNDQARVPELKKAEGIMKEYLQYVKSEPLIGHMDNNPFGVKTSLHKVISDSLNHLSQLLPDPSIATS